MVIRALDGLLVASKGFWTGAGEARILQQRGVVLGLFTRFLLVLLTSLGIVSSLFATDSLQSSRGSQPLRLCVERVSALVRPLAQEEIDRISARLSAPDHMSEVELRDIYGRLIELITQHGDYYENGQFLLKSQRGKKIRAAMKAFLLEMAERSGEAFEIVEQDYLDETTVPVVKFLPSGSRFGRYVKFLQDRFEGAVVYSPFDSRPHIVASFELYDNRILISHDNFLSRPIDDVLAHETQHMAIASDLREGKNSVFHSRVRRGFGLDGSGYQDNLALDELSAYAHDVRRGLLKYPIYSQGDVNFSKKYLTKLALSFKRTVDHFASRLDAATTLAPDKIQWSTRVVPPKENKSLLRSVDFETDNLHLRFDFRERDGANHLMISVREAEPGKALANMIRNVGDMRSKPRSPVFETEMHGAEVDRLAGILAKGELTPELKEELVLMLRNRFNAVVTISDEAIRYGSMAGTFQALPSLMNGVVPKIPETLSYSRQGELERILRAIDDVGDAKE